MGLISENSLAASGNTAVESKNSETLQSFVAYCARHPEFRFWQALRNWIAEQTTVHSVVLRLNNGKEIDTFYIESKLPGGK